MPKMTAAVRVTEPAAISLARSRAAATTSRRAKLGASTVHAFGVISGKVSDRLHANSLLLQLKIQKDRASSERLPFHGGYADALWIVRGRSSAARSAYQTERRARRGRPARREHRRAGTLPPRPKRAHRPGGRPTCANPGAPARRPRPTQPSSPASGCRCMRCDTPYPAGSRVMWECRSGKKHAERLRRFWRQRTLLFSERGIRSRPGLAGWGEWSQSVGVS